MPFDNYPQYLRDILQCIKNIESFITGMTVDEIRSDRKTEAAVERELGIVAEAGARLGRQAEILCPGPDWQAIRGLGNVLRHAYDRLDREVLQDILDVDLPALRPQVERALARLSETT